MRDFEEGLRKLEFKLRNNEVNDLFHILDRSNTGEITFSNFSIFVNGTRYNDSENKLNYLITKMASSWDGGRDVKRAFERIDRSDKGYITARDFYNCLMDIHGFKNVTKDECKQIMLRFDENGDDKVSYREFIRFIEKRMRLHTDMSDVIDRFKRKFQDRTQGENPWSIFHDMDRDGKYSKRRCSAKCSL